MDAHVLHACDNDDVVSVRDGTRGVLIDIVEGKADAQAKDVADATVFMDRMPIVREGSYQDCDDADIIVNAVGVSRKPGQTRLDMLDVTIDIMKDVTARLNQSCKIECTHTSHMTCSQNYDLCHIHHHTLPCYFLLTKKLKLFLFILWNLDA